MTWEEAVEKAREKAIERSEPWVVVFERRSYQARKLAGANLLNVVMEVSPSGVSDQREISE